MKLPTLARVIVACFFVSRIFAQGTLTPPGPPAPTMKTLDQIASTGIAINAINTPGDSSNQFIINTPGHYYLTGNITGVNGKRGILLNSDDITIDLNGFQMRGVAGSGVGISDGGVNRGNVTICNGKIVSWGFSGIYLQASFDSIIHDLIVTNNGQYGITCGDDCNIRDCVIRDNAFSNVVTGFNANISHCSAVGSATGIGFDLGQDSSISACVATFSNSVGIRAAPGCQISHCAANQNAGGGIQTDIGAVVQSCTTFNNSGAGITIGAGSTVTDSAANQNTAVEAIQSSTGCTLVNCTASGNTVQYGIVLNPGSTAIHCTASNNTSSQTLSAGIFLGGATLKDCTANSNTTTNGSPGFTSGMGIFCSGTDSVIQNCNASGNAGDGINVASRNQVMNNLSADNGFAGVHATNGGNRLEGNQLSNNSQAGMQVDATVNLVIRNAARSNSPNYDIVPGNRVATIVTPLVNSFIFGDTGGTSFSSDVTVNIVY